jgi:hypothetical protein
VRPEVLAVVKMFIFWVVTPCGLVGRPNVLEKHAISIFKAKVSPAFKIVKK